MAKKRYSFYPKKDLRLGDKYILKEYISEGTFGYVWSALKLETEEIVALKIPKDQERGDNALSEGQRLVGQHHPNIIKINWMGRVDGVFVIEMEYFPGKCLSEELTDSGFRNPKTFKDIFKIFLEILEGVKFLHNQKICHGDIKPQNILINGDRVKITDFGTSKFIENVFVKTVDAGGTWPYMAPEIAGSNKRYLISDIYSLGVLLYQLLTGRTPHETPIQVINNVPFPRPREINDSISKEIENVIMRALERQPEDRYQSVDEFKEDFIRAINQNGRKSDFVKHTIIENELGKDWMQNVINLYQDGKFDEAETILKYQKENGKLTQDVLYHMAYVYFNQKRYYDSLSIIEKIEMDKVEEVRRESFKDNVFYLKAKVYMELKKYDEAMMLYEYLSKKNPENINYKYRLAIAYGLANKTDSAIEILEQINEETPGLLYIVKKLGYAYDIKKDFSKARAYFKYALKLDPNDELIRKRLEVYDKYL